MSPMGSASWFTVEGDDEDSATNINRARDRETVLKCFYIKLGHVSDEKELETLRDFKAKGTAWRPDPEMVGSVRIFRGDGLVLQPMTIHSWVAETNVLVSSGIIMFEHYLCYSINTWHWDANGKMMRKIKQAPEILKFYREMSNKDPHKCGFIDVMGLMEMEQQCSRISAVLDAGGGVAPKTHELSRDEVLNFLSSTS